MAIRRRLEERNPLDLDRAGFNRLLERLDGDVQQAGAKFEFLRQKLIRFFMYRGADHASDLVDETINRLCLRLTGGETIQNLAAYSFSIARNVLRESWAKKESRQRQLNLHTPLIASVEDPQYRQKELDLREREELRFQCLTRCLEKLPAGERELLLRYYALEEGEKIRNRRKIAEELSVRITALRLRMVRMRQKLQICLETCAGARKTDSQVIRSSHQSNQE